MGQDVARFLRSGAATLAPAEALRSSVAVLTGVSAEAQAALETIHINSVFDLAASRVFADAAALVAIANDPTRAEARLNALAGDIADLPPGVPIRELLARLISMLRTLGDTAGPALAQALDVATIRDLALWPPHLAAKAILAAAFFPEETAGFDPDAPADLLPKSGVYPTERVFYRKLVLDALPTRGQGVLPIEGAEPLDITVAAGQAAGFDRLATGALLTFSQSWFSEGLTLGAPSSTARRLRRARCPAPSCAYLDAALRNKPRRADPSDAQSQQTPLYQRTRKEGFDVKSDRSGAGGIGTKRNKSGRLR